MATSEELMNPVTHRVVLRDHAGWWFVLGIGALTLTPILAGLDRIAFVTGPALRGMDAAGEVLAGLSGSAGILLLFTANVHNAMHWRLARKHDPVSAPFFRNRQAQYAAGTFLCWLMVASLNHLEQSGDPGFLGAAAGVAAALLFLLAFDTRFTPQDLVEEVAEAGDIEGA